MILIVPFVYRGINFVGPINLATCRIGNHYILIATNYAMKWVEPRPSQPTRLQLSNLFYEHIITKFDCPLELINNQRCCNLSLGLATKARACESVGQK